MSPTPRRCLLLLLVIVSAVGRVEVGQSSTQAPNAFTTLDAEQVLRLIIQDVTAQLHPLVNNLATRIDRLDTSLISFGSRLDGIETRLGALDSSRDSRLDGIDTRLAALHSKQSSRLDGTDARLGALNSRVNTRVDELVSQVNNLTSRVDQGRTSCDKPLPRDCSELPAGTQSGIHRLRLGVDPFEPAVAAYCDLDEDGGGWTVIQRRADVQPRLDFDRDWAAYREGFGELDSEFWWGLEKLWQMTGPADRQYQLRVSLADFEGERRYASYREFNVASGARGYRLTVDGYSGDAGDSMKYHNGRNFSTKGRDQDGYKKHCAEIFSGGWWFGKCYQAYLNGLYLLGEHAGKEGINWYGWKPYNYSLKESEMKIRPVNID